MNQLMEYIMYLENNDYCNTSEYYDECEDANQVNFCDDWDDEENE